VAGAAVLLALSLAISGGTLDPYALALVTVSGGAAFVAARSGLQGEPSAATRAPVGILSFGITASLSMTSSSCPGYWWTRPGWGASARGSWRSPWCL
jgi:hypothetical protein